MSGMQDKIAKLLAKAEATDNEHEADAFTAMAERLMVKWGIEEAVVRSKMGNGAKAEAIVVESIRFEGRYAPAHISLGASVLAGLGNLRCLQTTHRGENARSLKIIGHEGDVARAIQLLTSLQLQVVTAQRKWWRTFGSKDYLTENEKFKARRQFVMSFGSTVGERLAKIRREEIVVTDTQSGVVGTALVLLDRKAAVDEYMTSAYGKLRSGRGMQGSNYGHSEGRQAGNTARLGQTSMSNRRAALAG